ncbi:MAG: tyrosine-type recombinase/integrase [bacterium]|nr:tyrosine-type recombinase/integrase [bacterium]
MRWYEKRANSVLVTVAATLPHGLKLSPAATGGLVLMADPQKRSPYSALQAGDILESIAGQRLATDDALQRLLGVFSGKIIRISVNKGGRRGTTGKFIKAGDNLAQARVALARFTELRDAKAAGKIEHGLFTELCDGFLSWARTPALSGYSQKWLVQFSYTKKNGQPGGLIERLRARFGAMNTNTITRAEIEKYIRERESAGVGVSHINHEVCLLRRIFDRGRATGLCSNNPAADIHIQKPQESAPKFLTDTEVALLLELAAQADAARLLGSPSPLGGAPLTCTGETPDEMRRRYNADGTFDAARIRFLLLTGLRKSQFADMKWDWYSEQDGTLTLQSGDGHSEKSGRANTLPLPADARALIAGQPRNSVYIFPGLHGGQDSEIHHRLMRAAFAPFEKRTGRHLHMHMLRHTALTYLLRHTRNIALVSKYATHSKIETTQIYAKILREEMATAVEYFSIGGGTK